MKCFLISCFTWNDHKDFSSDLALKKGDEVVLELGFGKHLGVVEGVLKEKSCNGCSKDEGSILRKATAAEKRKAKLDEKKKEEIVTKCRELIKKYKLPMKLVGVDITVDGGGIVFGFTAEERVDFRQLVRDLASLFQKSVRLQQIGSRDEAKITGGVGPCGRKLCCTSLNGSLRSISTEMARLQQISHRGNERLSGCCNRLMCCLAFEQESYENLKEGMPEIGEEVDTALGKGKIESVRILTQEAGIKLIEKPEEMIWLNINKITRIGKEKKDKKC